MRVAVNWACYIGFVQSENEDYQKAQEKGEMEATALAKFLEEIEEESKSARR